MDDGKELQMGCRTYRDRLEDYLEAGADLRDAEPEFAGHLGECASCREAVDTGLLAGAIVRRGCEPPPQVSGAFVTRVMAVIRAEESRRAAAGAIWRPIELLASRFALVASVLLLAASFYLVEFAPPFDMPGATSQTEAVSLMPEPPAQPANQDEVLMSLVEMENGY